MYHKSSNDHANADALSRLPLSEVPENILLPAEIILSMELIASSPVTHVQIQTWTKSDNIISQVLQFVKYGWPDTCPSDELKPYWIRQNELSLVDGCIMWASRVVVPKPGRQILLHELHKGHFGISKAKSRARSCIWWPGIDVDIEKTVKQCESCQQTRNSPPDVPILFAQFGLPDTLVSDNGTCFVSQEFEQFLITNGIHLQGRVWWNDCTPFVLDHSTLVNRKL